jgi:hypothetical protein
MNVQYSDHSRNQLRSVNMCNPFFLSVRVGLGLIKIFFLICIVVGGVQTGRHSARRPLTGLLYLPRVIVRMENLVEWMAGETEVFGEDLPRRHFVHHKFHLTRPGIEPGPPRWEASD